jgi:hypothetical protein
MVVNGLKLPESFVQLIRSGGLPNVWVLKMEVDAYGNEFQSELRLLRAVQPMEQGAEALPVLFELQVSATPEERQQMDADSANEPGFIPYLFDFSEVVWFGDGHEDSPFCFDFRDDPQEPSIIYWDDVYWRRVAPNFMAFIDLYTPDDEVKTTPVGSFDADCLFERSERPLFL